MTEAVTTAQVLEEAMDVVEDTLTLVEGKASWMSSNPKVLAVTVSLAAVAVGTALGYRIASKRLSARFRAEADQEVADVKAHYKVLRKEDAQSPTDLVQSEGGMDAALQELRDKLATNNYVSPDADPEPAVEVITTVKKRNVFVRPNDDWDYETEYADRKDKQVYVIHHDEFVNNEVGYAQSTLTYYEGDDVLGDDKDEVVGNQDAMVGDDLYFGHGSNDENVVYIRNERLSNDFEVLRSTNSYSSEVLGLEHSEEPRKFRNRDW